MKDEDGEWLEGQQNLCILIRDYFIVLFTTNDNEVDSGDFLGAVNSYVNVEQNEELTKEFSQEEFTAASKQMHSDTSAGHDGFNPAFYQRCWNTVGEDVFREAKQWLV